MQKQWLLRDWQGKYEKWVQNTCRHNTYLAYVTSLETFFDKFPEKKYLDDFSRLDLNDYKIWRIKDGVSAATINLECRVVQIFWRWLIDTYELPLPAIDKGYKPLKQLERQRKFLREDELKAVWACMKNDNLKLLFLMALTTGMRGVELSSLTWKDVDLDNKLLRVVAETSKNSRERTLPLRDDVVEMLKAIPNKTGYVFPYKGKTRAMWRSWAYHLRINGIVKIGIHHLRHTFATNMLRSGVDIRTVQHLMGHHDLKVTGVYLAPLTADQSRSSLSCFGSFDISGQEAPAVA